MTPREVLGYLLCAAGILLGIASWFILGWGWGVLALLLFLIGWYLLRSARRNSELGDAVDAILDVVDFD